MNLSVKYNYLLKHIKLIIVNAVFHGQSENLRGLLVWVEGFEPSASCAQSKRHANLTTPRYNFVMELSTGLEPVTLWLRNRVSANWINSAIIMVLMEGVEPSRYFYQWILSPFCLPFHHISIFYKAKRSNVHHSNIQMLCQIWQRVRTSSNRTLLGLCLLLSSSG